MITPFFIYLHLLDLYTNTISKRVNKIDLKNLLQIMYKHNIHI